MLTLLKSERCLRGHLPLAGDVAFGNMFSMVVITGMVVGADHDNQNIGADALVGAECLAVPREG